MTDKTFGQDKLGTAWTAEMGMRPEMEKDMMES